MSLRCILWACAGDLYPSDAMCRSDLRGALVRLGLASSLDLDGLVNVARDISRALSETAWGQSSASAGPAQTGSGLGSGLALASARPHRTPATLGHAPGQSASGERAPSSRSDAAGARSPVEASGGWVQAHAGGEAAAAVRRRGAALLSFADLHARALGLEALCGPHADDPRRSELARLSWVPVLECPSEGMEGLPWPEAPPPPLAPPSVVRCQQDAALASASAWILATPVQSESLRDFLGWTRPLAPPLIATQLVKYAAMYSTDGGVRRGPGSPPTPHPQLTEAVRDSIFCLYDALGMQMVSPSFDAARAILQGQTCILVQTLSTGSGASSSDGQPPQFEPSTPPFQEALPAFVPAHRVALECPEVCVSLVRPHVFLSLTSVLVSHLSARVCTRDTCT